MKIAIAARNLRGQTGVSAIVLEQLRRFRTRGDEVDVLGEKLDRALIIAAGGTPVKTRRLPGSRYRARRWFAARAERRIRRGNYDLVIGNSELLRQDVLFVHNLSHLEQELVGGNSSGLRSKLRFDNGLYGRRQFKICIANSEFTRSDLLARHGLDPDTVRVMYPGYDPAVFAAANRAEVRARVRPGLCTEDELLLGFITSGHYAKRGADILAETLAGLPQPLQQRVKVLAVGSEENTAGLHGLLEQHGLGSRLIARGKTAAIEDYYYACDLLFYPARMEEFGLVALEAAACGTPVLTSQMTGAAEVIGGGAVGLTERAEAAGFLPRLTALIESQQGLQELAADQHAAAVPFTWDRYFAEIFALYDSLS